jgi:hypothetical protein
MAFLVSQLVYLAFSDAIERGFKHRGEALICAQYYHWAYLLSTQTTQPVGRDYRHCQGKSVQFIKFYEIEVKFNDGVDGDS